MATQLNSPVEATGVNTPSAVGGCRGGRGGWANAMVTQAGPTQALDE